MIRKLFSLSLLTLFFITSHAQNENEENVDPMKGKFRRDNIFLGGSIGAGFTSGSFSIGANPEIGYTIAQWLDAGLVFNINYNSIRADYNYGYRQRSINYGGGPFFRIYPVRFLFLQGQLEQNWIAYNIKNESTGVTGKTTTKATSFLGGIGYTQRMVGQSSYYMVVMMDLMRDANSPYLDNTYGNKRVIPIIRAGFNFYLKPSRQK
jgi:hypothetical protein